MDLRILDVLTSIVGAEHVVRDAEAIERHSHDETEDLRFPPEVVVRPESTREVSRVLALANERGIAVTPQAGRTGLSGGALPVLGGIALDVSRMNRILEIDRDNLFVAAEPGVITQTLQEAVEEAGLFYPPDPASRGSCMLGGNLAEDAGGPRAAKYGTTGRYVAGLTVVLADGSVLELGGKNRKDVAGYDLLRLFVGSEGTLGVATRLTLRLLPLPRFRRSLWGSFFDESAALSAVVDLFRQGQEPSACEFMERTAAEVSAAQLSLSLPSNANAHLFLEADGFEEDEVERAAERFGEILLHHGADDVKLATSEPDQRHLWRLRRAVGEAVRSLGPYAEEDCAVPRSALPELLSGVRRIAERFGLLAVCYGHAADGNIHVNIVRRQEDAARWSERRRGAVVAIFEHVRALGGTITGEHGVGYVQREYLPLRHSPEAIALMRAVKSILDPKGILNPGKIFPPDTVARRPSPVAP